MINKQFHGYLSSEVHLNGNPLEFDSIYQDRGGGTVIDKFGCISWLSGFHSSLG